MSRLKRVTSLGCVKAKVQIVTLTWFRSLSHTWKQRLVLCSGVSSSAVLCLSQGSKSMFCIHTVVNDSCLVLFSKCSFPPRIFFHPSDKLVRADKGEVVMAQREARKPRHVFVLWRYSFWHRWPSTTHSTTWRSGNTEANRKICLQGLVVKQTIALVCRSLRKLWRRWVNFQLSNSTVTTEEYTRRRVPPVVYQRDERMSCWKPFWIWSWRLFQYCIRCDNNVVTMCTFIESHVRFLSNAKQATLLCWTAQ